MGHEEGSDRRRSRRALAWLWQLVVALGIYFVFAAKAAWHELAIGVVVAAIAATGSRAVLREHAARFSGRWRWIAEARRLPRQAATGAWEVSSVLVRHLFTERKAGSLLLEVPFDTGGDDDASATRRALAIAYTTITPDVVVLGLDRARRRLVYHRIEEGPAPAMAQRLGAAP